MRNFRFFIIGACSIWAANGFSFTEGETTALMRSPTPESEFRLQLHNQFEMFGASQEDDGETMVNGERKSVAKAVVFSAVVPGAGQFYAGSVLKGAIFLGVEALALTGHFHYHGRGEDLESEFEAFADQNWIEEEYWQWLSQISGIARENMEALREYEHENFSHFLPERKNQQYYENIGKYNQFNVGWVDTQNGGARDSQLREEYTVMRKDANDNFKRATTLATVALFNHAISALEAGLSTRNRNKRVGLKANLRMQGMQYQNEIVPALNLGLQW